MNGLGELEKPPQLEYSIPPPPQIGENRLLDLGYRGCENQALAASSCFGN